MDDDRVRARLVFGAYALLLGFVLLNPSAEVPSDAVTRVAEAFDWLGLPTSLVEPWRVEFVVNVAVMVPLAFLGMLAWAGLGWRDWTAYGFVLSMGVEIVQAVALTARSATFVDVVANTAGAAIGAAVVSGWRALVTARRSQ